MRKVSPPPSAGPSARRHDAAGPFIALSLFLLLMSLGNLAMTSAPVQAGAPAYDITPVSPPTPPTPEPPGGDSSVVTSVSEIFHHLRIAYSAITCE